MYDAVNDILLRSNHIELFYMDCKSFYKDRIIIMRMVNGNALPTFWTELNGATSDILDKCKSDFRYRLLINGIYTLSHWKTRLLISL